jgi:hypothetical protein
MELVLAVSRCRLFKMSRAVFEAPFGKFTKYTLDNFEGSKIRANLEGVTMRDMPVSDPHGIRWGRSQL